MSNRRKPKRPVPLNANAPVFTAPHPLDGIEWSDAPFATYRPSTIAWIREHAHEAMRLNVWECEECGTWVLCYDLHPGVTPFMVSHETLGDPDCKGTCKSHFYNGESARVARDRLGGPSHEWYRPSATELRTLKRHVQDHVLQGGLLVRPVTR